MSMGIYKCQWIFANVSRYLQMLLEIYECHSMIEIYKCKWVIGIYKYLWVLNYMDIYNVNVVRELTCCWSCDSHILAHAYGHVAFC